MLPLRAALGGHAPALRLARLLRARHLRSSCEHRATRQAHGQQVVKLLASSESLTRHMETVGWSDAPVREADRQAHAQPTPTRSTPARCARTEVSITSICTLQAGGSSSRSSKLCKGWPWARREAFGSLASRHPTRERPGGTLPEGRRPSAPSAHLGRRPEPRRKK
eukprot:4368335-Prymnesium_polylepis.1